MTSAPSNARTKKRGFRFISGAPAIGIGTSAIGGSVLISGDAKAKPVPGKHGGGIANVRLFFRAVGEREKNVLYMIQLTIKQGGNGGDALVPDSRGGNGGNGGIIIESPK